MRLSSGIVELIHHVELQESEWWVQACNRAVLGVLWLTEDDLSVEAIHHHLAELGMDLTLVRCQQSVDRLVESGQATAVGYSYRLTEQGRTAATRQIEAGEELERTARDLFCQTIDEHCRGLEGSTAWDTFNETLLVPMVQDLGAATYELLRGESFDFEPARYLDPFLDRYGDVERNEILTAIAAFLNPRVETVRRYILRQLTASFVLRAAGLDDVSLKSLTEAVRDPARFDCFLDTNVLFSALDLHDNPANEVAQSLLHVARSTERVDITYRVLPITLEEARSALLKAQESARGLVLSSSLVKAAAAAPMNGLVAKFIDQASQGGVRDARRYFDELMDNLLSLCRNAGIELHNESLDSYKVREDVATDINDQLEFERSRRKVPKSYEQVEHDVVLWHYAKDRRATYVESPLNARYWVPTVDYRFLGFDSYKSSRARRVSICIEPTALLQLLQFWVGRSEEMERAFVASIRIAFLFQEFDQEAEQAVLRILSTLSRFEDADELGEETVTEMVLNRELRRRIAATDDASQEIAVVREELISIAQGLRRDVQDLQERLLSTERDNVETTSALREKQQNLEQLELSAQHLQDAHDASLEHQHNLASDAKDLEASSIRAFAVTAAVFAVLVSGALLWTLDRFMNRGELVGAVAVGFLGTGAWLVLMRRRLSRAKHLDESEFAWTRRLTQGWWALLFGMLGSIIAAVVLSGVSQLTTS